MGNPTRQPRHRPNSARDAAIFADAVVGGGKLDNAELADKYKLTRVQISRIIWSEKRREKAN